MDTEVRNRRIIQIGFSLLIIDVLMEILSSIVDTYTHSFEVLVGLGALAVILIFGSYILEEKAKKDPEEIRRRCERLVMRYITELVHEIVPRLKKTLDSVIDDEEPEEIYNLVNDFFIETAEAKKILESYLSKYPNDLKRVLKTLIDVDLIYAMKLRRKHFDCTLWCVIDQPRVWKLVACSSSVPGSLMDRAYSEDTWIGAPVIREGSESANQGFLCYRTGGRPTEERCSDLAIQMHDYSDLIGGFKCLFFLDIPESALGKWAVVVRSKLGIEEIEKYYGVFSADTPSEFQLGLTHLLSRADAWRSLNVRISVGA